MCTLITFASPLPDPPQPGGALKVIRFENDGGGHSYPPGLHVFAITLNGCSCGLIRSGADWESKESRLELLRQRYEQKGWSATKIQRALRDAELSSKDQAAGGFDRRVIDYFNALLQLTTELHFIAHEHSGRFAHEAFDTLSIVKLSSLGDGRSFVPQDDVRYVIER